MFNTFFPLLSVIKNNRFWFIMAVAIFLVSFILVYLSIGNIDSAPLAFLEEDGLAPLEKIVEIITETSPFVGALLIFINNTITALQMLFLGVILGLSPIVTMVFNGAMLGVISYFIIDHGVSASFLATGILPHGILELSAIFLCAGLGMKLGFHTVFAPLPGKNRVDSFKFIWKEIITIMPAVVAALFIAAFLEMFLTPYLIKLIFGVDIPLVS